MDTFDNFSKYKIFLSVAENGSISKSANQLFISQPAISIAIKKLEDNLNTTLFIRKSKGVELTESGRILYDSVKRAFNILSDTENSLRFPESTGQLRIASSNVLCKYFLIPYLKAFIYSYPNTDVSITCTSSAGACAMLNECSIDLALAAKPENIGDANYYSLGKIEYIFVCTPSYFVRLNCRNDEIFEYGNIMLLNKDNISRRHINAYCARNNIYPSHILEANEMDVLIEFAKMGIGISCVVKQFVMSELTSGILTEIKLSNPILPREIGFLYNRLKPFNDNIRKFINTGINSLDDVTGCI
ncbi:LysR family transcriptional regulator [Clostridium sp. AF19-22AC]|mgnify:CR=1 FL=1|jgi:DNA-binding transcriptional LysR family regulator|uniref:LysR family transcriptional regulator n=1 Tax=Clostridia TaxID=186801 RepID=UPI000E502ED8|nr:MULTISPECIES: LysR family transcriptional regulator [Clostridia]RHR27631.1 LysR family transcriptional regulator [Clostridium sp. AF19-22AC]